jgi:hypothetical protein
MYGEALSIVVFQRYAHKTSCSHRRSDSHSCSVRVQRLYRIQSFGPTKGNGFVATDNIAEGALILFERPLISIAFDATDSTAQYVSSSCSEYVHVLFLAEPLRRCCRRVGAWLDLAGQWLSVRSQHFPLTAAPFARSWAQELVAKQASSVANPLLALALAELKTNTFMVEAHEDSGSASLHELRFGPRTAIANHSCEPNAMVIGGVRALIALQPIHAEQEIVICYKSEHLWFPTAQRRLRLGFECECPRCGPISDSKQAPTAAGDDPELQEMIQHFDNVLDGEYADDLLFWLEVWEPKSAAFPKSEWEWRKHLMLHRVLPLFHSELLSASSEAVRARAPRFCSLLLAHGHTRNAFLPRNAGALDGSGWTDAEWYAQALTLAQHITYEAAWSQVPQTLLRTHSHLTRVFQRWNGLLF